MNFTPLQLSLDIATPVTIFGSMVLFLWQSLKQKRRAAQEQLVTEVRASAIQAVRESSERIIRQFWETQRSTLQIQDHARSNANRYSHFESLDMFQEFSIDNEGMSEQLKNMTDDEFTRLINIQAADLGNWKSHTLFSNMLEEEEDILMPFLRVVSSLEGKDKTVMFEKQHMGGNADIEEVFKNEISRSRESLSEVRPAAELMQILVRVIRRAREDLISKPSSARSSEDASSVAGFIRERLAKELKTKHVEVLEIMIEDAELDLTSKDIQSSKDVDDFQRDLLRVMARKLAIEPELTIRRIAMALGMIAETRCIEARQVIDALDSIIGALLTQDGKSAQQRLDELRRSKMSK